MKFTSEDLMKAMCLNVGDSVKVTYADNIHITYELKYNKHEGLVLENDTDIELLSNIVNMDFEILPKIKRVGDLKCGNDNCIGCPLGFLCDYIPHNLEDNTLYEVLESYNIKNEDKEIYDLLKSRLDKEVI